MRLASLPVRSSYVVRAILALTLLVGFADLSRGGATLAPIALVVGYLILVPAVLATWQ